MRNAVKLCLTALLYVCVAQAGEARADPLVLVLNNPVQSIPYNGGATFIGSLTNTTSGAIIIGTPATRCRATASLTLTRS